MSTARPTGRRWFRTTIAAASTGAFALLLDSAPVHAQTYSIVTSTSGDAATAELPDIDDEELLVCTPGAGRPAASFLSDLSWEVIIGDADGDASYDDEPAEIDAIAFLPGASPRPTIYDAFVSFGSTQRFSSGQEALDGDLVRLRRDGSIDIAYPESALTSATGTSAVDVDALAIEASGAIYFSFAENETTSLDSLIAANGGPTLDDGCVFRLEAGAPLATLSFRETDLAGMVSTALGRIVSSIVDVQGLEIDPAHAGALLFAVASTASGLEGTIFTTANGGAVASLNGAQLTGDSMGFATEESLDGLAIVPGFASPVALEVDTPDVPLSTTPAVTVRILHGTPGGTVRLLISEARPPYFEPTPAPFGGVGLYYVDTSSALYQRTSTRARWRVPIDATGTGTFVYPTANTQVGIQRILQPLDEASGVLGDPIVMEAIP